MILQNFSVGPKLSSTTGFDYYHHESYFTPNEPEVWSCDNELGFIISPILFNTGSTFSNPEILPTEFEANLSFGHGIHGARFRYLGNV